MKVTLRMMGEAISCSDTSAGTPYKSCNAPAGSSAAKQSTMAATLAGVSSAPLRIIEQPAAKAPPILRADSTNGKFQGAKAATGPTGCFRTCIRLLGNRAGMMRPYVRRASSAYHLIRSAAMAHSARASARGLPCSIVSKVAMCSSRSRILATPFSRRAQRSKAGTCRHASKPL